MKVGNRIVRTTNEDNILFPKDGITKGDVIQYYKKISRNILPFMRDRPLTMERYPKGIAKEGFFQKNASDYFPRWIKRKKIKKKTDGVVNYVVCNDAATLIYLANQLCITPHLWLSKIDKLDYPDRMIFDLDPSSKDFKFVCATARALKAVLDELKLTSFVMTTGSKGLHVVVPLNRALPFDTVRACARFIANMVVEQDPKRLTLQTRKTKRRSKLLIDYLRNSFGATAVSPYAIRAKHGAPVATPLAWKELSKSGLISTKYTINNIFTRLSKIEDPWKWINRIRCSLSRVIKVMGSKE